MQHFLKATARAAGAGIVAAQFFEEFLVAVDNPETAFYVGFRGETAAAFTASLERKRGWRFRF